MKFETNRLVKLWLWFLNYCCGYCKIRSNKPKLTWSWTKTYLRSWTKTYLTSFVQINTDIPMNWNEHGIGRKKNKIWKSDGTDFGECRNASYPVQTETAWPTRIVVTADCFQQHGYSPSNCASPPPYHIYEMWDIDILPSKEVLVPSLLDDCCEDDDSLVDCRAFLLDVRLRGPWLAVSLSNASAELPWARTLETVASRRCVCVRRRDASLRGASRLWFWFWLWLGTVVCIWGLGARWLWGLGLWLDSVWLWVVTMGVTARVTALIARDATTDCEMVGSGAGE